MPVQAATVTRVSVTSALAVVLAAENRHRRGLHIYNDSGQVLYVKLGTGASAADFTEKLAAGGRLSMKGVSVYVGPVTGRLASGAGDVQVTESYG